MFNGLNNKLANVPTATGLSNVSADSVTSENVTTETLVVNGVDVGAQVAINTADITSLKQVTTGQTYASVGDTTTFDNNLTSTQTLTANAISSTTTINAGGAVSILTNTGNNNSTLFIQDTGTGNSINFLPRATVGGAFNNIVQANDAVMFSNKTLGQPLCITTTSIPAPTAPTGIRLTSTSAYISGGGSGTTSTSSANFTGSTITFTGTGTFNSVPNTSVAPASANDLTNKNYVDNTFVDKTTAQSIGGVKTFTTLPESSIAPTTANQLANKTYVDSVASSSTSINLTSDNTSGNYYIPFSKTTTATGNVLYIDDVTTPLSYNPFTSTLTANNFNGNASSATKVNLSSTISGTTYLVMSSVTANSTADLYTDNGGASYDTANNRADINITGNSGTTTAVAVTNTTSGTTYYPTFVDSSSGTPILRTYATDLGYDATNQRLKITGITPNNARNISLNGTPIGNSGNVFSIVMGQNAGPTGTMPNNCFCFGSGSGQFLSSTGVQNLFIGANSGNQVTSGRNNTFLGASAGRKSTTASYNTQIGSQSQSYPDENISGSYNTTIGSECYILNNNLICSTAIGAFSYARFSNTVQLGRPDGSDNVNMDGTMSVAGLATFGDIQAETLNIIGPALSTLGNVEITTLDVVGVATFSGQTYFQQNINLDNLLSPGTTQCQIYVTGGVVNYNAIAVSSNHYFTVQDSGGNTRNPLQITSAGLNVTYGGIDMFSNSITNANQITATQFNGSLNGNASSATEVGVTVTSTGTFYPVFISTTTSGNKALRNTAVGFSFDVGNQQFNTVKFNATGTGQITNTFTIAGSTPNITTNTGNTLTIQTLATTGGNINLASQGITGLTIAPTEITSPLTQPASNNSSTKIPTTAWVQSAITAGTSSSTNAINTTSFPGVTGTYYFPYVTSSTGTTNQTPYADSNISFDRTNNTLNIPNLSMVGAIVTATTIQTANGNTSTPSFIIKDTMNINFIPNCGLGSFNNFQQAGDSLIYCAGTAVNTGILSLSTWSSNTNGVKIKANEVLIGAGGTASTPTSSIKFDGSSASMNLNGDVLIAKNNITLSSGTSVLRIGLSSTGAINLIIGVAVPISMNFSAGLNTIYGNACGTNMTTGATYNTLMGHNSAPGLTSGIQSTFIGGETGFQTANGAGSYNTCVGYASGRAMTTTANQNCFLGTQAGISTTTGSTNTFVGTNAGYGNTSGFSNVFIGQASGYQTVGGTSSQNVCVGVFAGDSMTGIAGGNTLLGYEAGAGIGTGSNNTIIGSQAGTTVTGQNNIVIGQGAQVPTPSADRQIAIGTDQTALFIQGQLSLKIYGTIVINTTLTAPMSQFYIVAMSTATRVITLPNPTDADIRGCYVIFKRKNGTAFNISAPGNGIMPIASVTALATLPVTTSIFQVNLVCDGAHWSVIGQA